MAAKDKKNVTEEVKTEEVTEATTEETKEEIKETLEEVKEEVVEEKKEVVNMDSTAIDHKCPNCNAKLEFNPKLGKWKCEYCDSEFTIEDLQAKINNAATVEKNDDTDLVEDDEGVYVVYHCPDCGAEIVADEQTSATFCVYCGNTAILKNKLAGKFKPDYIIPFKTNIEDAKEAFRNINKGRIFCPSDFNNDKNIEKIRGVYIPFWLYDIHYDSTIHADATRVKRWTSGKTHYTQTDYYDVVRAGSMDFSKIPVDGSSRFDNALMNSIEPFDYKELKTYNHAYLSGFLAERYDEDKNQAYKDAWERSQASAEKVLLEEIKGYTTKVIKSRNHTPRTTDYKYALMPVYMVNVKYRDKYYTFAMNGQTGEFIGDIPLDKPKMVFAFFKMLIISGFIVLLIQYIMFLFGGA